MHSILCLLFYFSFIFTAEAPPIRIDDTVFADQWQKMLDNPQHTDVTFIVEKKYHVKAHKIVLSASSKFFQGLLFIDDLDQVCVTNASRNHRSAIYIMIIRIYFSVQTEIRYLSCTMEYNKKLCFKL